MKLYEIKNEYLQLLELIEQGEIPEEAIADTLQSVEGDINEKIDNIACFIKSLNAEAQAIKEEAKALNERAKAKENKAETLKSYIYDTMKEIEKDKIETSRNILSIRKSPASVYLDDEFIGWAIGNADYLLKYQDPTADKKAIADILKQGKELPHASLRQGENLQIK